jgi:hypothetical protein
MSNRAAGVGRVAWNGGEPVPGDARVYFFLAASVW